MPAASGREQSACPVIATFSCIFIFGVCGGEDSERDERRCSSHCCEVGVFLRRQNKKRSVLGLWLPSMQELDYKQKSLWKIQVWVEW